MKLWSKPKAMAYEPKNWAARKPTHPYLKPLYEKKVTGFLGMRVIKTAPL